jgi:hypothetical protein
MLERRRCRVFAVEPGSGDHDDYWGMAANFLRLRFAVAKRTATKMWSIQTIEKNRTAFDR